jgi:hypothetical protein
LVVGRWSLVVGRWSLVVGRWSLVVGRQQVLLIDFHCQTYASLRDANTGKNTEALD